MKLEDAAPWVFGACTTVVGAIGAWLTGAKLRDDRAQKREVENNTAASYYQKLSDTLIAERRDREDAVERLQKRVDDLRAIVEKLQDNLGRKDVQIAALTEQNKMLLEQHAHDQGRIEQLQGELRQVKQIVASSASLAAREG